MRSVVSGFLLFAFIAPAGLLAVGLAQDASAAFVAAFVLQHLGLLGERWFFFAQASYPQNSYHRSIA